MSESVMEIRRWGRWPSIPHSSLLRPRHPSGMHFAETSPDIGAAADGASASVPGAGAGAVRRTVGRRLRRTRTPTRATPWARPRPRRGMPKAGRRIRGVPVTPAVPRDTSATSECPPVRRAHSGPEGAARPARAALAGTSSRVAALLRCPFSLRRPVHGRRGPHRLQRGAAMRAPGRPTRLSWLAATSLLVVACATQTQGKATPGLQESSTSRTGAGTVNQGCQRHSDCAPGFVCSLGVPEGHTCAQGPGGSCSTCQGGSCVDNGFSCACLPPTLVSSCRGLPGQRHGHRMRSALANLRDERPRGVSPWKHVPTARPRGLASAA